MEKVITKLKFSQFQLPVIISGRMTKGFCLPLSFSPKNKDSKVEILFFSISGQKIKLPVVLLRHSGIRSGRRGP